MSFTKFLSFTDFLNKLKSRTKKSGAFKKSKAKINNFELSDDEGKHERKKKVSFLKSQRISSPSEDTVAPESRENEPPDSSVGEHNDSFSSQHSTRVGEDDTEFTNSAVESVDPQIARESSSKSLSYQTSDDTLRDMSLPLPSDGSVAETPGPEEKGDLALEERSQTPHPSESDLRHEPSAGLYTVLQATLLTITADYKCIFPQTVIIQIVWPRGSHPDPNQDNGLWD